jgi:RNA methyltransferase, TrmH family
MESAIKISSLQNPQIKNLVLLESKARERSRQGLFIIEGAREISRAIQSRYQPESCFFCPERMTAESKKVLSGMPENINFYQVSMQVYAKIAYREDTDGLIVTAHIRTSKLDDLHPGKNPLILILESVEKPGNLGAVLRTADAARLDAVIICDPKTDIHNPNVVRSSLGCLFSNNVVTCESKEAIAFLKKRGIPIYAAALQDSTVYHLEDYKAGTAFVMGTESDGLSEIWRKEADRIIKIPMQGIADSLNVSVSAAILVFEAVRQRSLIS